MPKVNLIIVETQPCLVHPNPHKLGMEDLFLVSNKTFFGHAQYVFAEGFDTVVLAETKPSESFKKIKQAEYILPIIQQHFQNLHPNLKVSFDPFWYRLTSEANTNINNIVNDIHGNNTLTQEMLNSMNISDVIALAHRTATAFSGDSITINLYLSTKDKIAAMENFFKEHAYLLPNNVASIKFTLYQNNEISEPSISPIIKGTGIPDASYETDDAHTTALAWKSKGLLPEQLLVKPERTKELLGKNPLIEVEVFDDEPVAPQPATATAGTNGLFANKPTPVQTGITIGKNAALKYIEDKEADYLSDYLKSKITIKEYLDKRPPIEVEGQNPPSDDDLIFVIRGIASDKMWDDKGKNLTGRCVPPSIIKIKNSQSTTFGGLAELIKSQIDEVKASLPNKSAWYNPVARLNDIKRSRSTTDFYLLIDALADPKYDNNWTRERAIKVFCTKYNAAYKLDYEALKPNREPKSIFSF